ncbi:helix-turn-helix domain-containing protein [Methylomonas rapida]|uniref:Helix-turn-helix domain-containing protein n=1 Tax=Methylomonas rapida TaxID=2963939 RepID=A0ABY7GIA8_9GAMM|nr:helix-turn-helix domain-containing protein [Methylomonas rapida]WAR44286.1 helix-turn-helix domain-containing protein [Methylomonas rapida]
MATNPSKTDDKLLDNTEAAAYIGVTPRTLEVWRCTKRHTIPFIKVGRLVKYRKSALDAFLDSRTIGAA